MMPSDVKLQEMIQRLSTNGYVIEDGKNTKNLSLLLKKHGVNAFRGYDQEAKKMIIAIPKPIPLKMPRFRRWGRPRLG